ncbi:MAG: phage portal protein [Candidatus Liberibacter europaeus]|uniref:Phage portal protein n=1 Tax=Candidatus Liberibacter europaeus TaxID=744859 RepID=A0A2T4VX42_9HYPH|nr:phage portal protein [Candidatus Liberibacter europaeus]PTL86341.1 MAG: phage portal protein [Candidatus Liberibacter europaeus]
MTTDDPKINFSKTISRLIADAEEMLSERQHTYIRAQEYYNGIMRDVPSEAGHSSVVSCDLRAAIRKIMPSICRVLLSGHKFVEYCPVHQGDEEMATAASDYVNHIIFPEGKGRDSVENAIYDALLSGIGILTWRYELKENCMTSLHTGLDEDSFILLVKDPDVEVLEHTQRHDEGEITHDLRIRRKYCRGKVYIDAVPPDEFLIHPDATDIDRSPIVGRKLYLTRSELISMGYDRDHIDHLPGASSAQKSENCWQFQKNNNSAMALEMIEYYELYVTIDYDGDGIAELRRVVMAGGIGQNNILVNEEWDELPFTCLRAIRSPHCFVGESLTSSIIEIQKIKTVLLRQTLDNLYWQNQPQTIVQEGSIVDPDSVLNPQFGQPIRVAAGMDVRSVLGIHSVPMIADKSFAMLHYLDQELVDRTGISDISSGLSPEMLKNMTATATSLIEQSGIGQVEMIVRTLAQGLEKLFQGLLRLIIQHQDKVRMVRLRDQWIAFDPRYWNADMDAKVNIGLGSGSRERDMMMMSQLLSIQKDIIMVFGMHNPFVSSSNIYNCIARLAESTGIQNVNEYFTRPSANYSESTESDSQINDQVQRLQFEQSLAYARLQAEIALKREKMQAEISLKKQQIESEYLLKEKSALQSTNK